MGPCQAKLLVNVDVNLLGGADRKFGTVELRLPQIVAVPGSLPQIDLDLGSTADFELGLRLGPEFSRFDEIAGFRQVFLLLRLGLTFRPCPLKRHRFGNPLTFVQQLSEKLAWKADVS